MLKNTDTTYGSVARTLHWAMAIIIITLLIVGFYMTSLPPSDDKWYIYGIHKATGLLILMLASIRLVYRLSSIQPPLPKTVPVVQAKLSKLDIIALYCLMFAMPLSGFLGSLTGGHDISFYNIFTIHSFGESYKAISHYFWSIHEICAYLLIACISIHFLGAIYHHFILKDNVLRRMMTGKVQ